MCEYKLRIWGILPRTTPLLPPAFPRERDVEEERASESEWSIAELAPSGQCPIAFGTSSLGTTSGRSSARLPRPYFLLIVPLFF